MLSLPKAKYAASVSDWAKVGKAERLIAKTTLFSVKCNNIIFGG
jgi:hypothetical protein